MASKIRIYTKAFCPFCLRAKSLLRSKDLEFDDVDIGRDPDRKGEMVALAGGRTTVPQVFIGERHIGGSDDLAAMERSGDLDRLLAEI